MKYSKIILSGILSFSVVGIGCGPNSQPNVPGNSPSPGSSVSPVPSATSSGIGTVASPKPSGAGEEPPMEPPALASNAPFIIGKSAPPFGSGAGASSDPNAEGDVNVVPSKVSGKVYGFDSASGTYRALANALVAVGDTTVQTDAGGSYNIDTEFSTLVDISAYADGYAASTVAKLMPGSARDIHLQPVDNRRLYNPNTISYFYETLGEATAAPDNKQYPNMLSFGDKYNSRFMTTLIDPVTGKYRIEVNPAANRTTAEGKLLIFDVERDGQGRVTNPTQMKTFELREDIIFRVGDTEFPEEEEDDEEDTSGEDEDEDGENELLTKFVNIHARFHDNSGFSNFVCNAYVVFPTGEKLLASRYVGGSVTNVSFRMPKIEGVSYTIEAHAGNASRGSDAVINDLHENDSVEVYLLAPPGGLTPGYTSAGSIPSFSWANLDGAKSYQAEVMATGGKTFRWEGFTRETSIKYPSNLKNLPTTRQYRFQLMAMDFNMGGLSVLNKAEDMRLRAMRTNNGNDLQFRVQLADHNTSALPRGYRVSYDTALFTAQ